MGGSSNNQTVAPGMTSTGPIVSRPYQPPTGTSATSPVVSQPYQPATAPASTNPNVYDQSAGAYTGALGAANGAIGMPNIEAFQNPWQTQVFDQSLNQLDRARQMAMNNTGAAATAANAFGGSRHGIAESETNRAFADQAGNLAANLNMQGFNTALGAGQQQQQAQLAGAGMLGNLANLGFGFGQQLTNNQLQQGAQQQAIMQALIDAQKGMYGGYTGAPASGVDMFSQILGGTPYSQSQTTKESPGLLGILGAGLSLL